MVGLSLGVSGVMAILVQGGLIRYLNPKIGNERSVYYGLSIYAIGTVSYTHLDVYKRQAVEAALQRS